MLDKILLGRYIQSDSFIHRLDPRTKLIGSFYFIGIIFLANNLWGYGLLMLFTFLAIALTGIKLSYFINGVKPMIWLILFTVVFQIFFTTGGDVYFQWGPILITSLGVLNAVYIFLRLVLIIMMSTILTLTTAPLELADGIEHLLRPLEKVGFPSHEIALMLSIALRYVPTLIDEAQKIMNAQRSRGVEFDQGSFIQRMKAVVPVLVPLFVSAFNRAEEMATAMEARGYRGGEGRTKFRQLQFTRRDLWVVVAFLLVTIVLIALRIYV
ncbi:energy-coupling factor transporter transmembrane protein EcfT [Tuanshanicoccus lijuaniae]|uniref:energy-coupling factor transporter transmembrane component T family protein n=1 Tax=Aerococcaceae bacterium zg-1292 TaxID=2774330 RepID=UPI0019350FF3|nr:energy-coupling factor transporter transmembrane protein EcfT [Aerococcaceae bacterium zg-1292]QQA37301.1 energy-coupling factor transporter transmembrane protein EcfT [Aerococcaceae bacterium zg-1292]